jgi:hypothetical protein
VRIWDVEPGRLCDRHLVAEHGELHGLWSVLTNPEKRGYAHHPETLRWRGKLAALYARHERLCAEMSSRGFQHRSPLDEALATGKREQTEFVDALEEQERLLAAKPCGCLR